MTMRLLTEIWRYFVNNGGIVLSNGFSWLVNILVYFNAYIRFET